MLLDVGIPAVPEPMNELDEKFPDLCSEIDCEDFAEVTDETKFAFKIFFSAERSNLWSSERYVGKRIDGKNLELPKQMLFQAKTMSSDQKIAADFCSANSKVSFSSLISKFL